MFGNVIYVEYPKTGIAIKFFRWGESVTLLRCILDSCFFTTDIRRYFNSLYPKFRIARTQYSTEIKMSAHESKKLRSPFTLVSKLPPAVNYDAVDWNLPRYICARF